MLGGAVGAVSWGLGRVYNFFAPDGIGSVTFSFSTVDADVGQQILSGVNNDAVSQLMATLLGGQVDMAMGFITAIIAGMVVVFLGSFLKENIKQLPSGKKPAGKLATTLLYGSLLAGVAAGFFASGTVGIPAVGVIVAMLVAYLITAVVYGFLAGMIKQLPRPE